jgi:adenylate cyclase
VKPIALPGPGTTAARWGVAVAVVFGVSLVLLLAVQVRFGAGLQEMASDFLFVTRVMHPAVSTVIVGIDERSHRMLIARHGGMSQWPRTLYAQAIDALSDAGARVIGLAVFFEGARPEDAELSAAMRRAGNVVIPVLAQGPLDFDPRPGVAQRFQIFVRPTDEVRRAAAAEGLANITVAQDSIVRGLPLLLQAGEEELPAMPLTIAALYARRPRVLDARPEPGIVHAAGRAVPVGEGDIFRINFCGPPSDVHGGPYRIVSFVDVVDGTFDRSLIRDRVVLLGMALRGLDENPTPTTSQVRMSGVEVLANAVETIVHQRFLRAVDPAITSGLVLALAIVAALLVVGAAPWLATIATLAVLMAYLTAAALVFERGFIMDLVYPPAALLLTFALALTHRVVFVEGEKRMVRQAMGRYVSPAVGRWLLENPRRLAVGGEQREMSVLFSDIRDFTAFAHGLPPDTLVTLLNEYRREMSEVVFNHDGVLAQYVGDAIEAFWNAPMEQADHARRACQAALDMRAALDAIRPLFTAHGWPNLDIGIGINTGLMIVGNMGSRKRLDYTAVGDAVNVASRVEGLTKEYGVHIVIGEDAQRAAGEAFVYRFLDRVAVKGRPEPLSVYELLAPAGGVDAGRAAFLDRYHTAVECYRARKWQEAAAMFAALADEAPGDGPIALYRERSRAALASPPPPDWNGVHIIVTK